MRIKFSGVLKIVTILTIITIVFLSLDIEKIRKKSLMTKYEIVQKESKEYVHQDLVYKTFDEALSAARLEEYKNI